MPDRDSTRHAKIAMRRELASRRRILPPQIITRVGRRVCELICDSPEFAAAGTIALYAALPDEVPTQPLFEAALASGKRILLPRISAQDCLEFGVVKDWKQLRVGRFGVLEPEPESPGVPLATGHLVIVPGVGFTPQGHRLGRGKGYYDRALAAAEGAPGLFGLCFSCQLVVDLPSEAHDQRVQAVVSERGIVRAPVN